MKIIRGLASLLLALCIIVPASLFASSHREAPIAALDHGADVTDWYAFAATIIPTVSPWGCYILFLKPTPGTRAKHVFADHHKIFVSLARLYK